MSSILRTVCGLALLAAAPAVLAACTSVRIRSPQGTSAQAREQTTVATGGLPPVSRPLGALGGHASGEPVSGVGAAPIGAAAGGPTRSACGPCPSDSRLCEDRECCCHLLRWCGGEGINKSYAIAAADIIGYEFLLNQFDRHLVDNKVYGTDLESIKDNLNAKWVYDKDPFKTNQFMHPYGGAIYHGFARSAGLNFWESFGYDVAGSALWEIAGETDPPSINDQITTPIAGAFLGEALFRMANEILEGSCGRPSRGTEWKAALVSPSTGVNRWIYGDRFDAIYPSNDPAVFTMYSAGFRHNTTLTDTGVQSGLNRDVAVFGVSHDYGLPGKRGYSYDRPFDYFHFEATGTSNQDAIPESLVIRGLLVGRDYCYGPKYAGVWGLYGDYDYFSAQIFKLSSTAVSVGTTGQYLASDSFALQGSLLLGLGFTATGTTANERVERGYRYSESPQALVALRAVYRDRVMLDVMANEYFLADSLGSNRTTGAENVLIARVSLTVRVAGRHAVGIGFIEARRDTGFEGVIDVPQTANGFTLFYTLLSDTNFGVVRE